MKRRAEETEWPETAIAHKHLSRTFIGMSIDVMPCTSAMSVASVESIHGLQEEQDLMGFERELARVLPENHAACPRAPPPTASRATRRAPTRTSPARRASAAHRHGSARVLTWANIA